MHPYIMELKRIPTPISFVHSNKGFVDKVQAEDIMAWNLGENPVWCSPPRIAVQKLWMYDESFPKDFALKYNAFHASNTTYPRTWWLGQKGGILPI